MLYWLAQQLDFPGVLNLIRYLSFRAGAAIATALVIGLLRGPRFIGWLRVRQGKGQKDRTTMLTASARYGARPARASRRQDHDDVSPRHEPGRPGREEPDGPTVSANARGSRASTGVRVAPPPWKRMPMNRLASRRPPRAFLDTRPQPRVSAAISHSAERVRDGLRAYPRLRSVWRPGSC